MPTYEYACRECGHQFEIVQSFTDDALTECPECAGALKKVFNAPGIAFKGTGFYKNDARGSKSSSTTSGSAGSDTSTGGSDSTASTSDSSKKKESTSSTDSKTSGSGSSSASTSAA